MTKELSKVYMSYKLANERTGRTAYQAVIKDPNAAFGDREWVTDVMECACLKTLINILKHRKTSSDLSGGFDIFRPNGRINFVNSYGLPISTQQMKAELKEMEKEVMLLKLGA